MCIRDSSGSGDIAKADELYGNGQLGFFPVPDVDGMENMETNVPLHAGFAYAFNKQTYDDVMEEFFQYLCNEFTGLCYDPVSYTHLDVYKRQEQVRCIYLY